MTRAVISDVIAGQVRACRRREGVSREELAERARAAGAPETFTAVVVGTLETGRPKAGRRTREWTLDELQWVAAALEVTPAALLADHAGEFLGQQSGQCAGCAGGAGELERQTRQALESLDELQELEPALAAAAVRLAREADTAEVGHLPRLTRELRATLELLTAGRRQQPEPDDGDELADDLGEPDGGDHVDLSGLDAAALDDLPDADDLAFAEQ